MRAITRSLAFVLFSGGLACTVDPICAPPPPPPASVVVFSLDEAARTGTVRLAPTGLDLGESVAILDLESCEELSMDAHPDGSAGPSAPFAVVTGDRVRFQYGGPGCPQSLCVRAQDGPAALTCDDRPTEGCP